MKNVEIIGKTYYAVLAVPADVRGVLNRVKFRKSLETEDPEIAVKRADYLVRHWKAEIATARGKRPVGVDGFKPDVKIPKTWRKEFEFGEQVVYNLFSNYVVIPQFKVLGGKYIIDWYIPELSLAIEFDEPHHKYQKLKDRDRQEEIEAAIGCRFVRYTY